MPAYPYMFEVKDEAEPGDEVLNLPPGVGPYGRVVVALPEALDLVKYMQGLNHTYPVLPPPPQAAASTAAPVARPLPCPTNPIPATAPSSAKTPNLKSASGPYHWSWLPSRWPWCCLA